MSKTISYELVISYWAWRDSSLGRHMSKPYRIRKEFEGLEDARTARELINKYIGDTTSNSEELQDLLYTFTNDGSYFDMPSFINKVTRESVY